MELFDRGSLRNLFVGSCNEKDDIIKNLFVSAITPSIKDIDEKNYNLLGILNKYENEINSCINMSNYYINEAYSSNLKSEKVRRKLRIHIYTIYKDGQREVSFPSNINLEDSHRIYNYVSPSTFTFNIHGYVLNLDENDKDLFEKEECLSRSKKIQSELNSNNSIKENGMNSKEMDSQNSYSDVDNISDISEQEIDYYSTSAMKFTSFFSTIIVMRDTETIIYDKKNKNYYDCDKLTFTRIVNENTKETMKIFLFLDQKIPFFELSPELKDFMKSSEETLPEIIRCIYAYSLENDLIDSSIMKTDEVLKSILEVDEYEFSELPKLLKKHISIQKPIVLEHVIDLENSEQSESIYDIVIDTFEPYVSFENGEYKKFLLDSHKFNKLLELLRINEKEYLMNNKLNEMSSNDEDKSVQKKKQVDNNSDDHKNSNEDQILSEIHKTEKDIMQKENFYDNSEDISLSNIKESNNLTDVENDNEVIDENITKQIEEQVNNDMILYNNTNSDVKKETKSIEEKNFNKEDPRDQVFLQEQNNDKISSMGMSTFELINGLQNEINELDEKIIKTLNKIKHKNGLRLHYKNFCENPCKFIDHFMNSKFSENMQNVNDNSYIYEQAANINDDNYYKLPWVHRGISKYLLIKNKNFDDILKTVLNSMNLECKRKENPNIYENINNTQGIMLNKTKDKRLKTLKNNYTQQNVLKNNSCEGISNKYMNYPQLVNNNSINTFQNFGNNINYINNNMQNPYMVNMDIPNNVMHYNGQDNYNNLYNQQVTYPPQYMMNSNLYYNETMSSQNNMNQMYNMTAHMEQCPNGNFYNFNNNNNNNF
ncbi:SWI/SNF-related matrix-associated actin- dependent regulator of chromatin [Plasmodium reichenowi]|uniref:SWI/SNF-related matrix-associated actin-dependent regulator of chromatin n=1 Tax=Plasmodium reichenowi TaxID=5854 RepID=A0A151LPB3_PLARE|nr:SWI/SNF-related matrix-associated actin- dependent regulator of chromatin [Plasmodium reichenowi]KYO00996.1 SWI/SNF-related matrix-associated actin- dependent regulator of chromatin [Plasmodium reichenowi]